MVNLNKMTKGKEVSGIAVTIGNTVYIITNDDPEWRDWETVPSYDDPEMIYDLMVGNYVDEYKALISNDITSVVEDETNPGSEWSELLDQAYEIYRGIQDGVICNSRTKEMIFEQFYDLLSEVVCTFYRVTYYNEPLEAYQSDIKECCHDYNNLISTLQNCKKRICSIKDNSGLIRYPNKRVQDIDRLILIFNLLIKKFYDKALNYAIYFRTYEEKSR